MLPHRDGELIEDFDGYPVDRVRTVRASACLLGEDFLKMGLHCVNGVMPARQTRKSVFTLSA